MQNTSFQRSILHTILYFTLFCAIATGCDWCKGSVNKSTNITIEQKPPVIPGKKVTPKETDSNDPTKESLDVAGKDKKEEKDRDQDDDEKNVEKKYKN